MRSAGKGKSKKSQQKRSYRFWYGLRISISLGIGLGVLLAKENQRRVSNKEAIGFHIRFGTNGCSRESKECPTNKKVYVQV